MRNEFGDYFTPRRPDPYGLWREGSTRFTRGLWRGVVALVVLAIGYAAGFALGLVLA